MAFTLQARQGDTLSTRLTLKEDDNTTPINLNGCSVEFSIAPVPGGAPAQQYTTAPEVTIPNANGGVILLTLTPTQTRALTQRWYVYEVTVTFTNSSRLTVLDGALTVEQEVKA